MKLQELGLKSKPQTKYFEGGYVSFSTDEDELYFEIFQVKKIDSCNYKNFLLSHGQITSKSQFEVIFAIENLTHALVVITS